MSQEPETKGDRREKKLRKQKERMQKHGKGLAQIYKDVVSKRLKSEKEKS
ncbi:MAG: hypothetical protein V1771_04450 [Chloroflexota bacterium]